MGLLWTGKVSPKQDILDVLGSRLSEYPPGPKLSESHWRAIERAGVTRIKGQEQLRYARLVGLVGAVLAFLLAYGGAVYWAGRIFGAITR